MQFNNVFNDWLRASHITDEVANMFGLSMDEDIVIPVHDEHGNVLFNKYRRSPLKVDGPKYRYDKGGRVSLYGWHKAKEEKSILILEGEKDALVAWSHNIPAITSTGGCQSFQKEWADLFIDKDVTICFDNDAAGAEGMVKTLSIIPHAKVVFIPDRPNVKDVCDYVSVGGDLHELVKTAKHFSNIQDVADDRLSRLALFKSVYFHDAYIAKNTIKNTRPKTERTYSSDDVSNARGYPIPNLMEFKSGKAVCPFHHDKGPSLHYYPKTNTCYCFGQCGRVYDAIDIYRNQNKCSFKDAVNQLNKL